MSSRRIALSLILLAIGPSAFAQQSGDIRVSDNEFRLRIGGQGAWVCSAESRMKKLPVLARAETQLEARTLAMQECAREDGGDAFFCRAGDCERTPGDARGLKLEVLIRRDASSVFIETGGPMNITCQARDSLRGTLFLAKAPTQLEASRLARRACFAAHNDGFFCREGACEANREPGRSRVKINVEGRLKAIEGAIRGADARGGDSSRSSRGN